MEVTPWKYYRNLSSDQFELRESYRVYVEESFVEILRSREKENGVEPYFWAIEKSQWLPLLGVPAMLGIGETFRSEDEGLKKDAEFLKGEVKAKRRMGPLSLEMIVSAIKVVIEREGQTTKVTVMNDSDYSIWLGRRENAPAADREKSFGHKNQGLKKGEDQWRNMGGYSISSKVYEELTAGSDPFAGGNRDHFAIPVEVKPGESLSFEGYGPYGSRIEEYERFRIGVECFPSRELLNPVRIFSNDIDATLLLD